MKLLQVPPQHNSILSEPRWHSDVWISALPLTDAYNRNGGLNHLILGYNSDWPTHMYDIGKGIAIRTSMRFDTYRPGASLRST